MFIWEQTAAFFKSLYIGCLAFVVMGSAGFGWKLDVGGVHGFRADYAYTFAYSTEKIQPDGILGKRGSLRVTMGKNEREGLQFIVRGRHKNTLRYSVELSNVTNANGSTISAKMFKESYILAGAGKSGSAGMYPDALIPYQPNQGRLEAATAHINQGYYIELRTGKDTPAGIYSAEVTVISDKGQEQLRAPFTVEVVDAVFPDASYSETAVGIEYSQFYALNSVEQDTPGGDALYKQYYEYLLDHKISSYYLPHDILSGEADAYMSDPRVTSFILPYPEDDARLQEYYAKVLSNPDWARKALFYPIDEPGSAEDFAAYNEITDRLAALCPGYHMVTPFFKWAISDGGADFDGLAIQGGRSDILCPHVDLFLKKGFPEALAERVEGSGGRAWWYPALAADAGCGNLFIHQPGTNYRLLFWQQYQQALTGFLYWCATYWDRENPWLSSATFDSYEHAGEGSWFYPGRPIGLDGPVPSLRLKNVADGLEDYDLLRMAEEKFGRDYCLEKAAKLSKSLTRYTRNPAKLEIIRVGILRDLAG